MDKIEPNTMILDAVNCGNGKAVEAVLMSIGMHCLHCAFALGETVAQAAEVHGIDPVELCARLNEAANS